MYKHILLPVDLEDGVLGRLCARLRSTMPRLLAPRCT